MKSPSLKKIIVPSIPVAVILMLAIGLLWTMVFFNEGGFSNTNINSSEFFNANYFFINLIIIGLTVLNILLISNIVNRFSLIRTKTFLPVFLYLLTLASWESTHNQVYPHLLMSIFILVLMIFFNMYRNTNASEHAFLGSLLFSVAGLIYPIILIFIPITWIGFMMLQSFSLKTWLASVFGALLPHLFVIFIAWASDNQIDLTRYTSINFELTLIFNQSEWFENLYYILLAIILIIGIWGLTTNMNKDSIQSRTYLRILILFLFSILTITFLFAGMQIIFLPLIAMLGSIITAHPFTVQKSPFYVYTFWAFVAINLLYIIFKPVWG